MPEIKVILWSLSKVTQNETGSQVSDTGPFQRLWLLYYLCFSVFDFTSCLLRVCEFFFFFFFYVFIRDLYFVKCLFKKFKIKVHVSLKNVIEMKANAWQLAKSNEPPLEKTIKMACAPSEDSDQPGHLPSLIRVFPVRMKKAWVRS